MARRSDILLTASRSTMDERRHVVNAGEVHATVSRSLRIGRGMGGVRAVPTATVDVDERKGEMFAILRAYHGAARNTDSAMLSFGQYMPHVLTTSRDPGPDLIRDHAGARIPAQITGPLERHESF